MADEQSLEPELQDLLEQLESEDDPVITPAPAPPAPILAPPAALPVPQPVASTQAVAILDELPPEPEVVENPLDIKVFFSRYEEVTKEILDACRADRKEAQDA